MTSPSPYDISGARSADQDQAYPRYSYSATEAGYGAPEDGPASAGPAPTTGSSASSASAALVPVGPADHGPHRAGGYPPYPQGGFQAPGGYPYPHTYPPYPQGGFQAPGGYPYPHTYPVPPYAAYGQGKSKVAAGMLGLLLGGLGIHNFYLGYPGKGGAQLALTIGGWILIFSLFGMFLGFPMILGAGIWGFVEGIIVLCATPGVPPWGVDGRGVPLTS